MGKIAPLKPNGVKDLSGVDYQGNHEAFTRDFQTFWAMFLTSMLLVLAFTSIKAEVTRLSDNRLFQAFSVYTTLIAVTSLNVRFGDAGINPALSAFYIMFEVSQYQYPNTEYESFQLNHYLWAYFVGSLAGGAVGGLLHWIHKKCIGSKGAAGDEGQGEIID